MKKLIFLVLIFGFGKLYSQTSDDQVFQVSYELARALSRDLFDLNGVDIMQPSVEVLNAVSNSRFFYTAHVNETDKVKFRFGLHAMNGWVPDNMREFNPALPSEEYNFETLTSLVSVEDITEGNITSPNNIDLINYIFKTIVYDGINDGSIVVPETAATLLGNDDGELVLPPDEMSRLASARLDEIIQDMENDPLLQFAVPQVQPQFDSLEVLLNTIFEPLGTFPLPTGGDIRTVLAGVPQFDIMYEGWELNLRYIPKLNYGDEFGDFGFFGVGLKKMLTPYFYGDDVTDFKDKWNLALQVAYQNTGLENTVGVTMAQLESSAQIFNINLHGSKMVKNWFEVFAGLSYEYIDIETTYTYTLDSRVQQALRDAYGLSDDPNDDNYWVDDRPQVANIPITDNNVKLTLGASRSLGPIDIFAAYSLSQFNIFSFGVAANF